MFRRQSYIFIHMERVYAAPIYTPGIYQRGKSLILRGRCAEHYIHLVA